MSRAAASPDPLHKATLAFKQHGRRRRAATPWRACSPAPGSTPAPATSCAGWPPSATPALGSVLDVGCGYGPLALWLAVADADRTVVAVDRDARALEATTRGAAANGVADRVEVLGSLGYDEVGGRRFDLVTSNVPAKVGPAALRHLVARRPPPPHARRAGRPLVVVDRLAEPVAELPGRRGRRGPGDPADPGLHGVRVPLRRRAGRRRQRRPASTGASTGGGRETFRAGDAHAGTPTSPGRSPSSTSSATAPSPPSTPCPGRRERRRRRRRRRRPGPPAPGPPGRRAPGPACDWSTATSSPCGSPRPTSTSTPSRRGPPPARSRPVDDVAGADLVGGGAPRAGAGGGDRCGAGAGAGGGGRWRRPRRAPRPDRRCEPGARAPAPATGPRLSEEQPQPATGPTPPSGCGAAPAPSGRRQAAGK